MSDTSNADIYQKRIPIFPRSVKGRYRVLKWSILALAYSVYFLLPWLPWQRENAPTQAVLFDIEGRHFYLFDLIVFAQDIFWLAGLLFIGAFLLFFVTGVAGRVFCGYFCFQTLWTDVFMFFERLVQGERPARIRLYKQDWNLEKALKIGLTHFLWLFTAFVTGLTFTLYWAYAPDLVQHFFIGQAPFPAYATTLFLTLTTYLMAGMAREQVCTYMCPYSRFQSAMFDHNTLIVAYDEKRGEGANGRAKLSKELKEHTVRQQQGYGDCIDCGYCVQVCPTGIDIRDGMQYQCISCALCVDACNSIMDSVGYPRGLVRYTSEVALEGGKTNYFNFKNVGYAVALLISAVLLVWSVIHRDLMQVAINQVRQPLFVQLSDGRIKNSYEIKIDNKTSKRVEYKVAIRGLDAAVVDMGHIEHIVVEPEKRMRVLVHVKVPLEKLTSEKHGFQFVITPLNEDVETHIADATFYVKESLLGN